MTTCGYFGVIIPDYDYCQGFFLHERFVKLASETLAKYPRDTLEACEVRRPADSVSNADQKLLGALCALLVRGACSGDERLISHAGGQISALTGSKYFVVKAKIEAEGSLTEFERMPDAFINSPDAARDYIHSLPEVQLIQGRLLKEAADLVLNDKKRH